MWPSFYLDAFCVICLLYLPGTLVARGMRMDGRMAVMMAPMVSFAAYAVMGILYGMVHIPCGWLTMALPLALLGAALCYWGNKRGLEPLAALSLSDELKRAPFARFPRLTIWGISSILAILTGMGVCFFVFVNSLPSPDVFVQNYDNAWHLTRIAQFMRTGDYSSLSVVNYPSAWHGIAAMAGGIVGASVPMAENAANAAMAAVVYPMSSLALLCTLFYDKPRRVVAGAAFCLSIAFFPWRIMLFGPLFPNLASFEVMPLVASAFIILVRDAKGVRERALAAAFFVIGGIALALLQPNGIFSCAVFLMPFCLSSCRRLVRDKRGVAAGIAAELALLVVFVGIWLALVYSPQMHDVVWYPRPDIDNWVEGIKWAMALCFMVRRLHFLIGGLVIIGGLVLLADDERRWLTLSYVMTAGLYVVAYGVSGIAKNLLTGFWYSDYWRLASATCVFAVPLLAVGVDALLQLLALPLARAGERRDDEAATHKYARLGIALQVVVAVAMLAYNYYPFEFVPWDYRVYAFDTVRHNFTTTYDPAVYEYAALTPEEIAFMDKVSETVPEGEAVLNQPFDGSVFGYSVFDVDVLYPMFAMDPNGKGKVLKQEVNTIADDKELQDVARELGVKYLLQLDQGDGEFDMSEKGSYLDLGYKKKEWKGVNAVRDDTPGFSVVLSDGDMRLYRIDAAA